MFKDMKQLYELQKQAREIQRQLEGMTAEKTSRDNLIRVTVTGLQRVKELSIDPSLLSSDKKETLEKSLIVLINDSLEQIQKQATAQAGQMMKGL